MIEFETFLQLLLAGWIACQIVLLGWYGWH